MRLRRGVAAIVLLALVMTPAVVCSAQETFFQSPSSPPTAEVGRILSLARDNAEIVVKDDDIRIYFASSGRPPARAVQSVRLLVAVVEEHVDLDVDLLSRRLEIFVLPYDEYIEISNQLMAQVHRQRPNWAFPDLRSSLANFLVMEAFAHNVILTYDFNWNILAHELVHVAIMRGWSEEMSVDHNIVYAVQAHVVAERAYLQFIIEATAR